MFMCRGELLVAQFVGLFVPGSETVLAILRSHFEEIQWTVDPASAGSSCSLPLAFKFLFFIV